MKNMNLVRGVFLIVISLLFGSTAMTYSIGKFGKAGPGLFPLVVSCMLLVIGIVTVIGAHFKPPAPVSYNFKNIALVLLGLCGFALISQYVNMILGVLFLVFTTAYAASSFTVVRNLQISGCLVAIAFAFKYLLGLNLPLI
jgi:hypothetical protein